MPNFVGYDFLCSVIAKTYSSILLFPQIFQYGFFSVSRRQPMLGSPPEVLGGS
jgi:hypothetical protein